MKYLLIILATCLQITASAQTKQSSPLQGGVELDVLPYITGGYFGAAWMGKNHWRIRALTATVNKPDWSTKKGFVNHHIEAYAVVGDYFFKPDWKGFWLGGGLVHWKSTIQSSAKVQTATLNNWLLNGSMGYHFSLSKKIYLSPWGGLSFRVAGDKNVAVDDKRFTLPLVNPEASLKLGYVF